MRKLRLHPEDLRIDSFSPDPTLKQERGTVKGKESGGTLERTYQFCSVGPSSCGQYTCEGFQTQGPGDECVICA